MEQPLVKSAGRVLQIFEIFAQNKRAMRITEIAEKLGIPQSSASLLVKTLMQNGYLDYSTRGRSVQPTMRLTLLGSWINSQVFKAGSMHEML